VLTAEDAKAVCRSAVDASGHPDWRVTAASDVLFITKPGGCGVDQQWRGRTFGQIDHDTRVSVAVMEGHMVHAAPAPSR
jgi:hypothetical protein